MLSSKYSPIMFQLTHSRFLAAPLHLCGTIQSKINTIDNAVLFQKKGPKTTDVPNYLIGVHPSTPLPPHKSSLSYAYHPLRHVNTRACVPSGRHHTYPPSFSHATSSIVSKKSPQRFGVFSSQLYPETFTAIPPQP